MSGGYVPLFGSLTTGTLYGRWPDIGLWPIILCLADRHGTVDVTPEYLSGITGLARGDVIAALARFCEPDPHSRSAAEGGRRLALIDPGRPWAWRVVNHSLYREKARKRQWDAERTASGRDAARKSRDRGLPLSRRVPACPAKSRESPLSDSDSDSDIKSPPSGGVVVQGPDPRAELWRLGAGILGRAGKSESAARSLVGRWIRDHGEASVAAAIASATTAADPAGYITATLTAAASRRARQDRQQLRLPGEAP